MKWDGHEAAPEKQTTSPQHRKGIVGRIAGRLATRRHAASEKLPGFPVAKNWPEMLKGFDAAKEVQARGEIGHAKFLVPAGEKGELLLRQLSDIYGDTYVASRERLGALSRHNPRVVGASHDHSEKITEEDIYRSAQARAIVLQDQGYKEPRAFVMIDSTGTDQALVVASMENYRVLYTVDDVRSDTFTDLSKEFVMGVVMMPTYQPDAPRFRQL